MTATLTTTDSSSIELLADPSARERGLIVACAGRRGGVSSPPFDSLNLSVSVGDDPAAAMTNRTRVAVAAGFDPAQLALARQVHGAEIIEADAGDCGVVGQADGLVARTPGVVLGILTADCSPVLVESDDGVAVLHAGWRGLVGGVIEAGLEKLGGARRAWVGPSIRACCYEVGHDVTDAFERAGLPVAGERRVDVADGARVTLERCDVRDVALAPVCTCCGGAGSADRDAGAYFSYRRDGLTGRQGSFITLLEDA
ncbi:MAG: polyphenol oxidase family protein [Actinomycetota bacterium]